MSKTVSFEIGSAGGLGVTPRGCSSVLSAPERPGASEWGGSTTLTLYESRRSARAARVHMM